MKRILTIVSVLSLVMASSAMAADYGWSLSGSSTDPTQNTQPANPPNTQVQVYLWLACVNPDLGAAAMECAMSSTFPFAAGSFIALNGALATGAPDLLLALPCATTPTLFGQQAYFDFGAGGTVCLVNSASGGKNVTVDCDQINPQERPHAINGFSSAGTAPCVVDECVTISVENSSWGSIKGLYR